MSSDIGGLIVGKILKGRKLTKISPNKTISGVLGAFLFSSLLVPIFVYYYENFDTLTILIVTLIISLVSQLGDLSISYLKRLAKVKDTGDLLPGHGGFLDRADGILFSVPSGLIIFLIFLN
jgi:phosphatidate cytidylyltransferase